MCVCPWGQPRGQPVAVSLYLHSNLFSFVSVFLSLLDSSLKQVSPNNVTVSLCSVYHWNSVPHAVFQYLFETIMGCLVPFSLINTCYSSIICRLQNARFQRKGQGSRLILMIICAFALFWLPYHIVNMIEVILFLSWELTVWPKWDPKYKQTDYMRTAKIHQPHVSPHCSTSSRSPACCKTARRWQMLPE